MNKISPVLGTGFTEAGVARCPSYAEPQAADARLEEPCQSQLQTDRSVLHGDKIGGLRGLPDFEEYLVVV